MGGLLFLAVGYAQLGNAADTLTDDVAGVWGQRDREGRQRPRQARQDDHLRGRRSSCEDGERRRRSRRDRVQGCRRPQDAPHLPEALLGRPKDLHPGLLCRR